MLYLGSIRCDCGESGEVVEFLSFPDTGYEIVHATEIDGPAVSVEVDVWTDELVTVGIQRAK